MRLPNWEDRLARLVVDAQTRRFRWGAFDCCTFAADAVQAQTGKDPMAGLRGYTTWRQAILLVRRLGGLPAAVRQVLGDPLSVAAYAQRGDIVMVATKLPALGVVVGASALVPLSTGVQRLPVGDWVMAWRVE
jgi:hypothetical protein